LDSLEQEAKRTRVANRLAVLASSIMAVWAAAVALLTTRWSIVGFDVLAAVGFLAVPLLDRAGASQLARLVLVTLANGVVFVFASLFAGTTGTHYCFLPLSILPFALFSTRRRLSIAWSTALPAGLFAVLVATDFGIFAPVEVLPSRSWIFWLTVATAFTLCVLATWSFRRENERSEQALRESRTRFGRIVESTQEGICVTGDDGRITYVNPALTRMLGAREEDLLGRSPLALVRPADREQGAVAFRPREDGGVGRIELELARADGGQVTAWVSSSPAHADRAAGDAAIALILDVTETRRKERLIEEQRRRMAASAKLSALGEMAAGVAHEINNPLHALRLSAALIDRALGGPSPDPERARRAAAQLDATIDRAARIIEGLRIFSREEPARPADEVPVRRIVDDTLAFSRERFRAHGIELVVPDIPGDLTVCAHAVQVSQVLVNLLNNALHAVEGRAERRVAIEVDELATTVELSVTDSGAGIPEAVRERIFEPFFTTKPPDVGTGLGLSVSKGLVEAQGGTIRFESEPGRTRFTIALRRPGSADGPRCR
jgi:PAS domain S-box-containing protein